MKPSDWLVAQQSFPLIDTNGNGEMDAYELKTFHAVAYTHQTLPTNKEVKNTDGACIITQQHITAT